MVGTTTRPRGRAVGTAPHRARTHERETGGVSVDLGILRACRSRTKRKARRARCPSSCGAACLVPATSRPAGGSRCRPPPVRNAICPGERWEAVGLAFELRIDLDLAPRPEPAQLLSYLPPDRCVELLTGEGSCSRALSMGCSRLRAPGRPRRWPPCARSSALPWALKSPRSSGTGSCSSRSVGPALTSPGCASRRADRRGGRSRSGKTAGDHSRYHVSVLILAHLERRQGSRAGKLPVVVAPRRRAAEDARSLERRCHLRRRTLRLAQCRGTRRSRPGD